MLLKVEEISSLAYENFLMTYKRQNTKQVCDNFSWILNNRKEHLCKIANAIFEAVYILSAAISKLRHICIEMNTSRPHFGQCQGRKDAHTGGDRRAIMPAIDQERCLIYY
ncbi:hypothetical protein Tsp_10523 [Trichinella spiralis]|uniref:hypothetical protein n=1 Tax=Trichinella spiralis TaxID=6334 RepID=UPI0001EFD56D|nr:hypothetical protein Tsp_10523 [Trichinella spiralis]